MSLTREPSFQPIPVCAIKSGMHLNFNLYFKREENFHLIVEKGAFYPEQLTPNIQKLNDLSDSFYIQLAEKPSYYEHIETYLKQISYDEKTPLNEKSLLIYKSATDVINDLFNKIDTTDSLVRGKSLIDHTINIILGYDESIKHLMRIGSYDYYTYTHSVDVSILVIGFANYLGYTFENLRQIGYAAIMHDIGKNEIAHHIINKDGKLTDEEFECVKKHPIYSYELLKFYGETNEDILMGVRSHHEKVSGNGYPDKLKRNEIHDFAKMISICDIFNALTTERSYKKAYTSFNALKLMKDEMLHGLDEKLFYDFIRFIGKSSTC